MRREIRSIMRPTVATTTCAPARRRGACWAIGWPPKTATTSMSRCSAYERSAWVTWMQSSRVGVITIACSSSESGSRYWSSGRPNAAVLPVPVWAWPITSCPASSSGIACSWTGVGSSKPSSSIAVWICSESPSSWNAVIAGKSLRGGVQQQLALGAARRECPRARAAPPTAGGRRRSRPRARPAATAREQLADRRARSPPDRGTDARARSRSPRGCSASGGRC